MPFKVVSQKSWLKGLVASMDRFSLSKGALQRSSNFLLSQRGALTVCDGTGVIATGVLDTSPGGNPIEEIGIYVDPFNFTIIPIMAAPNSAGMGIYQFSLTPVSSFALIDSLPITPNWDMPQFVNFAGVTVIALGNQAPVYQYDPANQNGLATVNGFAPLSHNTSGQDGAAGWQANTFYSIGQRIAELDSNGNPATWQVVSVQIGSSAGTMSNTSGVGAGGMSGATMPFFGNPASTTKGTGDTRADNQIIWMEIKEYPLMAKQYPPLGAAHIIKHANALWAWNTSPTTTVTSGSVDGPSVLRMSDPNNVNSWPMINTVFVGRDDGTQGTGLATFTIAEAGITPDATLVVFKDYSTFTVRGVFQAADFAINQVKSDMGCLAPRSIQFATGFGVMRFCHLGFALFTGTEDRLFSEEIREPYIFGDKVTPAVDFNRLSQARSALTADPPLYVCSMPTTDGNTTRIFCYDLVMRAWMIVDYMNGSSQYPVTCMQQLRPPYDSHYNPVTVIADLGPGNVASIRRWQQKDPAWDATNPATPIGWSFRLPEIGEPGSRAYFRRSNVRLTAPQAGRITGFFNIGSESQPLNTQLTDGAGPSHGTPPNVTTTANYLGNSDFGVALDIAETGPSLNATFSGTGPANIEGCDFHVTAKNPRPFGNRW